MTVRLRCLTLIHCHGLRRLLTRFTQVGGVSGHTMRMVEATMTLVRFYVGGQTQADGGRSVSDEEWAGVALALAEFSGGWTEYQGQGMWEHCSEPTRIYEVLVQGLPPAKAEVQRVAREMARAARQEKVLWTMQEVMGGFEG